MLFFLPILLAAMCVLMPKAATAINGGYGFGLIASIVCVAATTFAASLCPFLILERLWLPALALVAAAGAGAWFFGYRELSRSPSTPLDEGTP
jgi:hypothetical protein